MSNPWFRMYAEFATDVKVQRMSEADQRRLTMLFCLRCGNGDETFPDEEVAFQLRISDEEWQRTKAVFVAKGFIDEDNNLLNWNKRQYLSDSSTPRVRKHREKKKQEGNVSETPPDTEADTEAETDIRFVESARQDLAPAHDSPPEARAPSKPVNLNTIGSIGRGFVSAGIGHINLSHPDLLALVKADQAAGVDASETIAEFAATSIEAVQKGKPNMAWVLATIAGRRREAAARGAAHARAGPQVSAQRQAIERLRSRGKPDAHETPNS